MATVRTLAELNILLGDNVAGNITPEIIRDLMVSFNLCYGEIGVANNSTPRQLANANWGKVTEFTIEGNARGVTLSGGSQRITVPVAGIYRVYYVVDFASLDVGNYELQVFSNGTSPLHATHLQFDSNSLSVGHPGHMTSLSANDYVELALRGPNGANVTIDTGLLGIERKE